MPGPPDYFSPWEFNANTDATSTTATAPTAVFYKFDNWTGDWGSPHLLTLRVTPYIGLAYYDGIDDGDYYGYTITGVPNLFANGSEIGNFVPARPFVVDGTGLPYGGTVELDIKSSADHCPVIPNTFSANNPGTVYFDVSGIVGTSTLEEQLLKDYGKVFYYYIEAIDPVTNTVVWGEYMMPDNYFTQDNLHWYTTGINAGLSLGYILPMYYNYDVAASMPESDEVIVDVSSIPAALPRYKSEAVFTFNGYNIKTTVKTDPFGMYVKIDDY